MNGAGPAGLALIVGLWVLGISQAAAGEARPEAGQAGAPFAAARNDKWRIIGAGGGGAQFCPAVSPHDPDKVFVSCDMTGSFVSRDGGGSWRMLNLRGVVRFWAFDPGDPQTVYANSIGLWRTTDGGKTWQLVHPDPAIVDKIIYSGDHAQERIVTRDGIPGRFAALCVDPGDSRTLYGVMGSTDGLVFVTSADHGVTWREEGALPGRDGELYVDPASERGDRTLYFVGESSVSVRLAGKWEHRKGPEGVSRFNDVSVAFPAEGAAPIIYAITGRAWRRSESSVTGVFVSLDGGKNWHRRDKGILGRLHEGAPPPGLQAIAAAPSAPRVAYLSYKNLRVDPEARTGLMGVAKTTDAGDTWELVWKESEEPGENIKSAWLNERFGPWWGENPFDLDVAPTDPDICFGTDFGRTMRTTDGGATWEAVYSKRVPGGDWSTTGLDVTCCYSLHFDPHDPKRVFVSYTDIGLMMSEDGGTSWRSATENGVPRSWLNSTYWVAFDPGVKGLMWAVMTGVHDLPRPKMWRQQDPSRYGGGVCVSRDGGETWAVAADGMGATTHIVLDPESPVGKRTLYVCGLGKGVFKSADNGATWHLRNNGIEGEHPLAWRLTRGADGTLYLVVVRESEDGAIGDDRDGALYRSTDGAENWEKMALPAGCNGPTSIVIDPKDPKRLCLSAWGRFVRSGDVGGGIYVSEDGGATWRHVFRRDQHIHDVTVDERNGVYYACGFESNAWRSEDRGETWARIRGYNFKWGRKVVPDPGNQDMVFVTTFGGSVWYGPAKGDPDAPEDIISPEVAYRKFWETSEGE